MNEIDFSRYVSDELCDDDLDVYRQQDYAHEMGFGKSPAVLVVDFQNGFKDPQHFGGGNIADAIEKTAGLLKAARAAEFPIAFTRHLYSEDLSDVGLFYRKGPRQTIFVDSNPASHICPELDPRPGELIIRKRYPSAFFKTDLASLFTTRGVDTVIITGCSTSGCVHASVVDCMGEGFRPMVVRDCCGDRAKLPHEAALLNLGMKYADVMSLAETMAKIAEFTPAASSATAAE